MDRILRAVICSVVFGFFVENALAQTLFPDTENWVEMREHLIHLRTKEKQADYTHELMVAKVVYPEYFANESVFTECEWRMIYKYFSENLRHKNWYVVTWHAALTRIIAPERFKLLYLTDQHWQSVKADFLKRYRDYPRGAAGYAAFIGIAFPEHLNELDQELAYVRNLAQQYLERRLCQLEKKSTDGQNVRLDDFNFIFDYWSFKLLFPQVTLKDDLNDLDVVKLQSILEARLDRSNTGWLFSHASYLAYTKMAFEGVRFDPNKAEKSDTESCNPGEYWKEACKPRFKTGFAPKFSLSVGPYWGETAGVEKNFVPATEIVLTGGDIPKSFISENTSFDKELEVRWGLNREPKLFGFRKSGTSVSKKWSSMVREVNAVSHERSRGSHSYDSGVRQLSYRDTIWAKRYLVFRPDKEFRPYFTMQAGLVFQDWEYQARTLPEQDYSAYFYRRKFAVDLGTGVGFNYYPCPALVLNGNAVVTFVGMKYNLGVGIVFWKQEKKK